MAEDSGAFKTNQRNSAQIGHFVICRDRCGKDASPFGKRTPRDNGRKRKYYRITTQGRAQLADQRQQWQTVDAALRNIWLAMSPRPAAAHG